VSGLDTIYYKIFFFEAQKSSRKSSFSGNFFCKILEKPNKIHEIFLKNRSSKIDKNSKQFS